MNNALLICLCIIVLIGAGIIGLTAFSSQAQTPAVEIIVEDADYVSTNATEYSADLTDIAKNVTSRVVLEYGESMTIMDLLKSVGLDEVAGIVSPRIVVEYADSISEYGLQSATVPNIAPRIIVEYADSIFEHGLQSVVVPDTAPRIIVEYADSIFSADLEYPFVTTTMGVEKSFRESSHVEGILAQEATLDNVLVTGDFNGTVDFTNIEIVRITTGPFACKGFSKGTWEATLEGVSYKGDWGGTLFLMPSERKIYLKGSVSGEISGTVEAYLTESVAGSDIYDLYQATWRIGRVNVTTTSATINLNGTLTYQSGYEFPAAEIYVLQTFIEGTSIGYYNGPLSTILTHLHIVNGTPYDGEGFSIISYVSDFGAGEGWTYDQLASLGIIRLRGLFTDPLFGIVSATLDESKQPRTFVVKIERVDLGLPPIADLKIETWGPGRSSPGETINYIIELRNDGLKSAENVSLICLPPFPTDFVSASLSGSYDDVIHVVRWDFENIPPKTSKYLSIQVKILWGLPEGTMLMHSASVYPKEEVDDILRHASPGLTEKQKIVLQVIKTAAKVPLPPGIGTTFSLVEFLGEEPFTPIIISNYIRANKAANDGRFEEAEYLRAVNTLLYNLQEDPEYLKKQNKTFCQAIEELAQIHNYTPPKGITQITVARDPNIKHGPEGQVLPGDTLNFTVEYENEGEGIAFGIYFTDTLDEDLDDSTLVIGPVISTQNGSVIAGPGTYNPSTRTITWLVGEVGPGEGGFANFSIKVKSSAPYDTEIINFATVYFPSVPETTKTNGIVSIVIPEFPSSLTMPFLILLSTLTIILAKKTHKKGKSNSEGR